MKRLITVSFLVDIFKRKGFIIIGSLLLLGSWMYQKIGYELYDSSSKLISADNERLIQALQAEQFTDFSIYMIRNHPNDSAYNRYRSNYFYTLLHRFLLVEYYCHLLMTEDQHFGVLSGCFGEIHFFLAPEKMKVSAHSESRAWSEIGRSKARTIRCALK